jgi:hypothetical protein
MQSENLVILVIFSFTEVEFFFTLLNLAHLIVNTMKNELYLYIIMVIVSQNTLEVVLIIAEIAHYSGVGHGPKGPFEPHVTYLHVQFQFKMDYVILIF